MQYARKWSFFVVALFAAAAAAASALARDVPYVPTPEPVVRAMLQLAKVSKGDMVYDLGSGDGRIVIMAAREFGARGVGVEIDPQRIAEARANARRAGVGDRVRFIEGDLFQVDLRPASVVTLYLLPDVNLRLRPKLMKELRPGTPVVSHSFDMGDWEPEVQRTVNGATIYLWHIPARASGVWQYRIRTANGGEERHRLDLTQDLDRIRGTLTIGGESFAIADGRVRGERLSFAIERSVNGAAVTQRFEGRISGERLAEMAIVDPGMPGQRRAATR